ncbi:hypothetical protein F4779DRAFT_266230 [Xylariaceae sp. FL0662B]|nr:hypothetical protein F4779DRAFT_266230 [Xylariaceae sp. FL0662B]
MASNTGNFFLDVSIHFDPRRISIGFRSDYQAFRYSERIMRRSFLRDMALDCQVSGRFVSLRLPSRVTDIMSSTSYEGFYLCFSDAEVASRWQDALLVWRFVSGSATRLYVERDIDNNRLNDMLGIAEPQPTHGGPVPARRDNHNIGPGAAVVSSNRPERSMHGLRN